VFALWLLFLGLAGPVNPDAACAGCHKQIYDSYQQTPMARASGNAVDGLLPGEFTHAKSGVHYRLFLRDGRAWLSYEQPQRNLKGEQELEYFIGSGQRGRTYLFENQGFWFESPVNWYGKQRLWDMNPKSIDASEMPFTLEVDPGCLHCHTSDVQPSLPGARNRFGAQPFLHAGITCESCHGDPAAHLASAGKAPILNPNKLPAAKRDSVCLQCHLEGELAVNKEGLSLASFHPGEDLSTLVTHFVHAGELGPNGRATSQWEALLQSECKRKSGDRLTCTTCHDPHRAPAAEEKVTYYRARCLSCHGAIEYVVKHHPEQEDCTSCHMPREESSDVAHEQVTDHRIQRRPTQGPAPEGGELTVVGGGPASDRDLGLAYFQLAEQGNQTAGLRAKQLLEKSNAGESDTDVHTALGVLDQLSGDTLGATLEYQTVLRANPADSTAAGDLAILQARSGDIKDAVKGLSWVATHDPADTVAGLDLAMIQCAIGDSEAAVKTLQRLLEFSPDDQKARAALAKPCSH